MSRKKLLLFVILPVSAVASLGGGFLMATFFPPAPSAEPNQTTAQNAAEQLPELGLGAARTVSSEVQQQRKATQTKLTQELNDVMRDMNTKRLEFENKTRDLGKEEERIAQVREAAQEDIQRLDEMAMDIANLVINLKKEIKSLEDSKIRVQKEERENLKVMAAVMGKMKPDNAADMLADMSIRPADPGEGSRPGIEEAALYIFLMDPKQQTKVFDAMIKSKNQALAARLMKTVKFIALEQ